LQEFIDLCLVFGIFVRRFVLQVICVGLADVDFLSAHPFFDDRPINP